MSANWRDDEVRLLLRLRAEDDISRHITGTIKDGRLLETLARRLQTRGGYSRDKAQVTSKLKSLRKKFHQATEACTVNQRSGQSEWVYFDLCHSIWGTTSDAEPPSTNPPPPAPLLLIKMEEPAEMGPLSPATTPCSSTADPGDTGGLGVDTDTSGRNGESAHHDRPENLPPQKRRKLTKVQEVTKHMKELLMALGREEEARDRLRAESYRAHEEQRRREYQEVEREAREGDRQMMRDLMQSQASLLQDMMQSQASLLRDLMARMPAPAPQHPAPAPQHPAATPQHPAPAPQHPAPAPQHPAATPQHPAATPQHQTPAPQDQTFTPQHQTFAPQHQTPAPQHQTFTPQHQTPAPQIQYYSPPQFNTSGHQVSHHNGGSVRERSEWPYFDLCHPNGGAGRCVNPLTLLIKMEEPAPTEVGPASPMSTPCSSTADPGDTGGLGVDSDTSGTNRDRPGNLPPQKRRRVTKAQEVAKEIKELLLTMDQEEEERERLQAERRRAHEEQLGRAVREADRRERDAMRDMMRSQASLLRALIARMPAPAPQHPTPASDHPDPGPQHPTPASDHPDPGPQHPDPEPQHPDPEPQHPTPEPQHPDPEPQHPTPEPQHPTPEPQHPAPTLLS